jgi:hypothetical protein
MTSGNAGESPSGAVVAGHIRIGMACERSARRQSANSPADQQLWLWIIRYGANRAGCMAVTEHITGPSASECCTALAAGRRVMPTGCGFWWLLGWIKAVPGVSPRRFTDGPCGFGASGAVWPPRGSGAAAPGGALRAIDASARPRSWRTAAGTACGGHSACPAYHGGWCGTLGRSSSPSAL